MSNRESLTMPSLYPKGPFGRFMGERMGYKRSFYNHVGQINENQVLMFNLVSSAVAKLDLECYERFEKGQWTQEEEVALAQNGFLVPVETNELGKVKALRYVNNYSTDNAAFQILPTTACNARCPYCYEQGFVSQSFPERLEPKLIEFISSYMGTAKHVHVTWFGGEPLLRSDFIERISRALIENAKQHGVGYTADIISNGSLVTEDIARLLKSCHVGNAQISLDGDEDEYGKRKNYVSGNHTLSSIFDSVDYLLEAGIAISIRINADRNNYASVLRLIHLLGERFASSRLFSAHVAPLYSTLGDKSCFEKEELTEVYKSIFHAMIDSGLITSVNGLPLNFNNASCCARGLNNFCIGPDGSVSKCDHFLGDKRDLVGTLETGVEFNDAMDFWTNPALPQECEECSYLPSCQAGCYAGLAMGFGYGRCPYIRYTYDAVFDAVSYMDNLRRNEGSE